MTLDDMPIIACFQRVLDPSIVMGSLYLTTLFYGATFSGYSLVLMVLACFVSSSVYRHLDPYRHWRAGRMRAVARDTVVGWCITVALLLCLGAASGLSHCYERKVMLSWFVAAPVLLLLSHMAVRRSVFGSARNGAARSAVIVGANPVGLKFAALCARETDGFMQLHGFFDDRAAQRQSTGLCQPLLGTMDAIAPYVRARKVKMIFISQPISAQPRIRRLLDELRDTTVSVYFLPDIYIFDLMQARFDNVGGMPVVAIRETPFMGLSGLLKRASDIVLGALIVLLSAPVMAAVALAVRLTSSGPVIFRQRRYGLYGEEIVVYKFRSMTVSDDGERIVQARRDDRRLTPIGAFLRRSSLDELPQFFNVLQGSMSIVGPRPHAVAHNEQYRKLIKGYMLRHKVKPGITGWAQVNGLRGETDALEKMAARIAFDLDYLRNWSLWLDVWIIVKTVRVVLRAENAH